jgi:hypothetical protein
VNDTVANVRKLTTECPPIRVTHDVLGTDATKWLQAYLDPTQPFSWLNIVCWCACVSWLVKYFWNWYNGERRYESYSQSEKWLKGILDTLTMLAVSVVAINGGWREARQVFHGCMEMCRMIYTSTSAIKTLRDLFFSGDTSDVLHSDVNWFYESIK